MKINVELFGLEVKHFSTNTITVAQSVWEGRVQIPKTASAFRQVDLHPTIADMLRDFVGDRKEGFHGLRRFRVTHLETSCVPPALIKYWTGHAASSDGEAVRQTVTDRYIKMGKDTKFRADVAERIGLGFELPKAETVEAVPNVPSSRETEVSVNV